MCPAGRRSSRESSRVRARTEGVKRSGRSSHGDAETTDHSLNENGVVVVVVVVTRFGWIRAAPLQCASLAAARHSFHLHCNLLSACLRPNPPMPSKKAFLRRSRRSGHLSSFYPERPGLLPARHGAMARQPDRAGRGLPGNRPVRIPPGRCKPAKPVKPATLAVLHGPGVLLHTA